MSRYHFNQQVTTLEPPGGDPRAFHRKLPGYEASPMVQARDIAESLGLGAVWVKNEFSRLDLPSFKILGASWGTYRALDERIGGFEEWVTLDDLKGQLGGRFSLSAATDGNHGRAVARMGKLLGLPASIYVPAGTADARIEGIRSEGATCEVVEGSYEDAVERSAQDASDDVPGDLRYVMGGLSGRPAVGHRGLLDDLQGSGRTASRGSPTSSSSRWGWARSGPRPLGITARGRTVPGWSPSNRSMPRASLRRWRLVRSSPCPVPTTRSWRA